MFGPTKIWRKWHRKTNIAQKRYATASALAATALPSLVAARGHRIDSVPEIPLVVANSATNELAKTKQAVALLKAIQAYEDVEKVKDTVKTRAGKGKLRDRRRVYRKGPLIVFNKKQPFLHALRNLPGIELVGVDRLNLLQLAPGGHLGRFVVWLADAFERLDDLFGTHKHLAKEKTGFNIPRPVISNPDLGRIINSDEIQTRLRPLIKQRAFHVRKKNPLTNLGFLVKLNPYAKVQRRRQILTERARAAKKEAVLKEKRAQINKKRKITRSRKHLHKAMLTNPVLYEGLAKHAEGKKEE